LAKRHREESAYTGLHRKEREEGRETDRERERQRERERRGEPYTGLHRSTRERERGGETDREREAKGDGRWQRDARAIRFPTYRLIGVDAEVFAIVGAQADNQSRLEQR
jgi:hypothetical protein